MSEAGLKGYEAYSWAGLWMPAGAPKEIVDKLNAAIGKIIATREKTLAAHLDGETNKDVEAEVRTLQDKLRHNTITIQLPIGEEADFEGIIDLVKMRAFYFDGDNGEIRRVEEIPAHMRAEAETKRHEMLDAVSMFSDELTEAILEGQVTEKLIHEALLEHARDRTLIMITHRQSTLVLATRIVEIDRGVLIERSGPAHKAA